MDLYLKRIYLPYKNGPPSFDRLTRRHRPAALRRLQVHHEVMRFIRKTIILLVEEWMEGWRMGVEPHPHDLVGYIVVSCGGGVISNIIVS